MGRQLPAVGVGYRAAIADWTRENLDRFDALEITVDHCLAGSRTLRSAIFDLVGRIPLTAHGVGLSLGTDAPLDLAYLDRVAEEVAESIIAKERTVQSRVPFPFLLENITYVFEWPDSKMSDAEFLNLICRETGAELLLDIENVYLNATNHEFDPYAFIDALSPGLVREVHMAGGITIGDGSLAKPLLADSHSHPVPDA